MSKMGRYALAVQIAELWPEPQETEPAEPVAEVTAEVNEYDWVDPDGIYDSRNGETESMEDYGWGE